MSLKTLLTHFCVLVDDWYQVERRKLMQGKVGAKPTFGDSEMLMLMLAHDFAPYSSETRYLAFIRANPLALFPQRCQPIRTFASFISLDGMSVRSLPINRTELVSYLS